MNMERYIWARILLFGFIIFAIIFIVIRVARNGGEEQNDMPVVDETVELSEMADTRSSSVQYIVDGKINSQEEHRQIRFTISENRRVAEVLQGYNGEVLKRISLNNTDEAYDALIYALNDEGFGTIDEGSEVIDSRGVCSSGKRYYYKIRVGASTLQELWASSCSGTHGTMDGDKAGINRLFENQFPGFDDFERGVKL